MSEEENISYNALRVSHSAVSTSLRPHEMQPAKLLCP